jgi:hypothetical protein
MHGYDSTTAANGRGYVKTRKPAREFKNLIPLFLAVLQRSPLSTHTPQLMDHDVRHDQIN